MTTPDSPTGRGTPLKTVDQARVRTPLGGPTPSTTFAAALQPQPPGVTAATPAGTTPRVPATAGPGTPAPRGVPGPAAASGLVVRGSGDGATRPDHETRSGRGQPHAATPGATEARTVAGPAGDGARAPADPAGPHTPAAWPVRKSIAWTAQKWRKKSGNALIAICANCRDSLAVRNTEVMRTATVPWIHNRTGEAACDRNRLTRSLVVCGHCHTIGYYGDPCPNGCAPEPLGGEWVIA